jgi:hypothetical protein
MTLRLTSTAKPKAKISLGGTKLQVHFLFAAAIVFQMTLHIILHATMLPEASNIGGINKDSLRKTWIDDNDGEDNSGLR